MIEARGIVKRFGAFTALDGVSVDVPTGSLTALLGPSGSGKSTLLRVIAGLEKPDAGQVLLDGEDVTSTPTQSRGVGFVFQHYAAFKHMTVWDNVAFGLTIRRRPRSEIKQRVTELLDLVQLGGLAKRYPAQLSGGQRQRMGLARALAVDTWNVSATVALPGGARGLTMQGTLRYTGTAPISVLVLGDGGTTRNGEKRYTGLNVIRAVQSDWSSEADIGITARNIDASRIELRRVEGFCIGLRSLGDGRGVEDSTFTLGRIVNCKIGLDVWCATATAWNTSIRYYGGHFACATGVNAALDRFGVRFGNAPGAYSNHNRHVFDAPNFELRQAGSNLAIPFLNETNGSAIIARNMRMEACSPLAARHTAGAQDCDMMSPVLRPTSLASTTRPRQAAAATRWSAATAPLHPGSPASSPVCRTCGRSRSGSRPPRSGWRGWSPSRLRPPPRPPWWTSASTG